MNDTPMPRSCANCKAWKVDPSFVGREGWCRFNPPQIVFALTPQGGQMVGSFPRTAKDECCEQHKLKLAALI
jgi:hypothetical protein